MHERKIILPSSARISESVLSITVGHLPDHRLSTWWLDIDQAPENCYWLKLFAGKGCYLLIFEYVAQLEHFHILVWKKMKDFLLSYVPVQPHPHGHQYLILYLQPPWTLISIMFLYGLPLCKRCSLWIPSHFFCMAGLKSSSKSVLLESSLSSSLA